MKQRFTRDLMAPLMAAFPGIPEPVLRKIIYQGMRRVYQAVASDHDLLLESTRLPAYVLIYKYCRNAAAHQQRSQINRKRLLAYRRACQQRAQRLKKPTV